MSESACAAPESELSLRVRRSSLGAVKSSIFVSSTRCVRKEEVRSVVRKRMRDAIKSVVVSFELKSERVDSPPPMVAQVERASGI